MPPPPDVPQASLLPSNTLSQAVSPASQAPTGTSTPASPSLNSTNYSNTLIVKVTDLRDEIEEYRQKRMAQPDERLYKHKVELAQLILQTLVQEVAENERLVAKATTLVKKLVVLLPETTEGHLLVKWAWQQLGSKVQKRAMKRERKTWWVEVWGWEDGKKVGFETLEGARREKAVQHEVREVLARCVSGFSPLGRKKARSEAGPALRRSKSQESVSSLEDWEWKSSWSGHAPVKPEVSDLETTKMTERDVREMMGFEDLEAMSDRMILELCPRLDEAHQCVKTCNTQLEQANRRLRRCEKKFVKNGVLQA